MAKSKRPISPQRRALLIGELAAKNPFMSIHRMAGLLANHGLSVRTWEREIAAFFDARGLASSPIQERGRQIEAAEELVQQIIDGRKGAAASLLRLLAELTGTLPQPGDTADTDAAAAFLDRLIARSDASKPEAS